MSTFKKVLEEKLYQLPLEDWANERKDNPAQVGVGKTHIAQALGHTACRMGYEVLFCKAVSMFRDLNRASRN